MSSVWHTVCIPCLTVIFRSPYCHWRDSSSKPVEHFQPKEDRLQYAPTKAQWSLVMKALSTSLQGLEILLGVLAEWACNLLLDIGSWSRATETRGSSSLPYFPPLARSSFNMVGHTAAAKEVAHTQWWDILCRREGVIFFVLFFRLKRFHTGTHPAAFTEMHGTEARRWNRQS